MKHNVNISINWKTQEIEEEGVDMESHRETLADDGFARAVEMIAEGFIEGARRLGMTEAAYTAAKDSLNAGKTYMMLGRLTPAGRQAK